MKKTILMSMALMAGVSAWAEDLRLPSVKAVLSQPADSALELKEGQAGEAKTWQCRVIKDDAWQWVPLADIPSLPGYGKEWRGQHEVLCEQRPIEPQTLLAQASWFSRDICSGQPRLRRMGCTIKREDPYRGVRIITTFPACEAKQRQLEGQGFTCTAK